MNKVLCSLPRNYTTSKYGGFIQRIRSNLGENENEELSQISKYYFDGSGKGIRPLLTVSIADALNHHCKVTDVLLEEKQRNVALIAEMYHTASLYHDDVIDGAVIRRNKESINVKWSSKKAIFAGNNIIAQANILLARIQDPDVVLAMSNILFNLVFGELQQMANVKEESEQDLHHKYLEKSFHKTGSLFAYSSQSVAILAQKHSTNNNNTSIDKIAFNFGKNVGMILQLVDDWLDLTASNNELGKDTNADMKLGLATAPVIYAAEEFPELKTLIHRRFCKDGDVAKATSLIHQSQGLKKTEKLTRSYYEQAMTNISILENDERKQKLIYLINVIMKKMNDNSCTI